MSREAASERKLIISVLSEKLYDLQSQRPLDEKTSELYEKTKADLEQILEERAAAAMFRCKAKWIMDPNIF